MWRVFENSAIFSTDHNFDRHNFGRQFSMGTLSGKHFSKIYSRLLIPLILGKIVCANKVKQQTKNKLGSLK